MSEATADVVGKTGASFTLTVSSGTVTNALLQVKGKPDTPLTVDGTGRGIKIPGDPGLPSGESWVRLDMVWAPNDPNAVIAVDPNSVQNGPVAPANPKHTLQSGNTPGEVELFGK